MLDLDALHYSPATASDPVLRGVSLKARNGQPVLIAGASGSGKTSLLEVISGLAGSQHGDIRWLCGIVFQFPERHFLGLTIQQELKLGQKRLGWEQQETVLKRVGLADVDLSTPPERLRGGQQRRLALAVQLLRGAEVLLLDEPTAGLDWSVRREVLQLMSDLAEERILIVVTHEPELFEGWRCDRHALRDGQLRSMPTLP